MVDDSIDEEMLRNQRDQKIMEMLKKSPNTVLVLENILKKAVAYHKYLNDEDSSRKNRNSLFRNSTVFKYVGDTVYFQREKVSAGP